MRMRVVWVALMRGLAFSEGCARALCGRALIDPIAAGRIASKGYIVALAVSERDHEKCSKLFWMLEMFELFHL